MSYPQCLSCYESLGEDIIDGRPYCRLCHHRRDVPREQCDCPLCFLPAVPSLYDGQELPELPPIIPIPSEFGQVIQQRIEQDAMRAVPGDVSAAWGSGTVPKVTVTVTADFVQVRIENQIDPDQWVELVIHEEAVGRWWRLMAEADPSKFDDDDE